MVFALSLFYLFFSLLAVTPSKEKKEGRKTWQDLISLPECRQIVLLDSILVDEYEEYEDLDARRVDLNPNWNYCHHSFSTANTISGQIPSLNYNILWCQLKHKSFRDVITCWYRIEIVENFEND